MNLKSLFEPIDNVIAQAKSFIYEQDVRKKYIKQIEDKVEFIKPELAQRRKELSDLIAQIDSDDQFKTRLLDSLTQLDRYLEHVELIAEKELIQDVFGEEHAGKYNSKREARERYTNLQLARLEEQLKNTNNFFEVADFANEIWADFDLFEEFHVEETVVQCLVDRMNETNAKNTETRMGRDLRKILEHIRLNLVKSTAWTDEEVKEYQEERDLKLNQKQQLKIPIDKNICVCLFGGSEEVIEKIYQLYAFPKRFRLKWFDFENPGSVDSLIQSQVKNDLVVFLTMYPTHDIFKNIKARLTENETPYIDMISFGMDRLVRSMEEELIRISFEKQFAIK